MPQLSLYIDKPTYRQLNAKAKAEHVSLSGWANRHIKQALAGAWPEGYFDLFGSIHDVSFKPPERHGFKGDHRRESL
ncbi:MAG: toxin-antitoxin system, antitoxin component [Fibrobacterota bacterium]